MLRRAGNGVLGIAVAYPEIGISPNAGPIWEA